MEAFLLFSPVIICLIVALTTKRIFIALGSGIITAICILLFKGESTGVLEALKGIVSWDKLILLSFTVLLIYNTQLLISNGSLFSLVNSLTKRIHTRKQALFLSYLSGLIIFFDDYANTLVIGNAFKPVADKYRISREKLAFIVDSTAAPVACIAVVSTWVGFELSQIEEGPATSMLNSSSYEIFLSSIPYSFYPILMLIFIPASIFWNRDFGPMWTAEANFKTTINTDRADKNSSAATALISICLLVLGTIGYLLVHTLLYADEITIQSLFSEGDPFMAMLFASVIGLIPSLIKSQIQVIKSSFHKAKGVLIEPIGILFLAWGLGLLIIQLNPAHELHLAFKEVPLFLIPLGVFLIAAVLSFSTGSSFGTMSILFPIVMPFLHESHSSLLFMGIDELIVIASSASILSGAIFGDHCSPISDTTILSSTATECDHLSHFKTQVPYALAIGFISCLGLYFTGVFQLNAWLALIPLITVTFFLPLIGKKLPN